MVHTPYPADFKLPMVAPDDLGRVAARLMTEPAGSTGIHYVEGPEPYSAADVAAAFAAALGRPVEAVSTPREEWEDAFKAQGFSEEGAASYAAMTAVTLDGDYETPTNPERGTTSLQTYISGLVQRVG